MEGKTNFSRRLKQLLWLDLTDPDPHILCQIYATAELPGSGDKTQTNARS